MRDEFQDEGDGKNVTTAAKKVGEGLSELGQALRAGKSDIREPVARFIQEKPLAALGIAFGIGYVLGGGLFSRATGRAMGLGWRLGGMALAKDFLGGLAGQAADRL